MNVLVVENLLPWILFLIFIQRIRNENLKIQKFTQTKQVMCVCIGKAKQSMRLCNEREFSGLW